MKRGPKDKKISVVMSFDLEKQTLRAIEKSTINGMKPKNVRILSKDDQITVEENNFLTIAAGILIVILVLVSYMFGRGQSKKIVRVTDMAIPTSIPMLTETPTPTMAIVEKTEVPQNDFNKKILVLNGTGTRGLAAKYRKDLAKLNFKKVTVGNMSIPSAINLIFYKDKSIAEAVYIADSLGDSTAMMVPLDTKSKYDIVIFLK